MTHAVESAAAMDNASISLINVVIMQQHRPDPHRQPNRTVTHMHYHARSSPINRPFPLPRAGALQRLENII